MPGVIATPSSVATPFIEDELAQALREFSKLEEKQLSGYLVEYLQYIANCGKTICPWPLVQPLILHQLEVSMHRMVERFPYDHLPILPNVNQHVNAEAFMQRILHVAKSFPGIPFTIQRLCELMTKPDHHYRRSDKFLRAMEKNLMVVTTIDPQGQREIYTDIAVNGSNENSNSGISEENHELRPASNSPNSTVAMLSRNSSDATLPVEDSAAAPSHADSPSVEAAAATVAPWASMKFPFLPRTDQDAAMAPGPQQPHATTPGDFFSALLSGNSSTSGAAEPPVADGAALPVQAASSPDTSSQTGPGHPWSFKRSFSHTTSETQGAAASPSPSCSVIQALSNAPGSPTSNSGVLLDSLNPSINASMVSNWLSANHSYGTALPNPAAPTADQMNASPSGTGEKQQQPLPSVETAFCSANRTLPLSQLTTTGSLCTSDAQPSVFDLQKPHPQHPAGGPDSLGTPRLATPTGPEAASLDDKESIHDQIGIALPASVQKTAPTTGVTSSADALDTPPPEPDEGDKKLISAITTTNEPDSSGTADRVDPVAENAVKIEYQQLSDSHAPVEPETADSTTPALEPVVEPIRFAEIAEQGEPVSTPDSVSGSEATLLQEPQNAEESFVYQEPVSSVELQELALPIVQSSDLGYNLTSDSAVGLNEPAEPSFVVETVGTNVDSGAAIDSAVSGSDVIAEGLDSLETPKVSQVLDQAGESQVDSQVILAPVHVDDSWEWEASQVKAESSVQQEESGPDTFKLETPPSAGMEQNQIDLGTTPGTEADQSSIDVVCADKQVDFVAEVLQADKSDIPSTVSVVAADEPVNFEISSSPSKEQPISSASPHQPKTLNISDIIGTTQSATPPDSPDMAGSSGVPENVTLTPVDSSEEHSEPPLKKVKLKLE